MQIEVDKAEMMINSQGQWLCLKFSGNVGQVIDAVNTEGLREVELRKKSKRRSLDANAYAWVLIGKIAGAVGLSKDEVYRRAIKHVGGSYDIVCIRKDAADALMTRWAKKGLGWQSEKVPSKVDGCVNLMLYYGSSTYDTRQMSQLIDVIVEECKALGIETKTPRELALLKEEWQ